MQYDVDRWIAFFKDLDDVQAKQGRCKKFIKDWLELMDKE